MDCPKCGKKVGDNDNVCSNCGVVIRESDDNTKLSVKLFNKNSKKKNPLETSTLGKTEKLRSKFGSKKLKILLGVVVIVLMIILIITLVISLTSGKGKKLAVNTSEYIGRTVAVAQSKLDVTFKNKSAYSGLNNTLKFDYVYESEDSVKVDGITYPEWAVMITLNEEHQIGSVRYCEFEMLKKDIRGEQGDTLINLDRFEAGTSYDKIQDVIDMEPYSITYEKNLVKYRYRYWYDSDTGDEQQVVLDVSFDGGNKFLDYKLTMLYPQNL